MLKGTLPWRQTINGEKETDTGDEHLTIMDTGALNEAALRADLAMYALLEPHYLALEVGHGPVLQDIYEHPGFEVFTCVACQRPSMRSRNILKPPNHCGRLACMKALGQASEPKSAAELSEEITAESIDQAPHWDENGMEV